MNAAAEQKARELRAVRDAMSPDAGSTAEDIRAFLRDVQTAAYELCTSAEERSTFWQCAGGLSYAWV